MCLPFRSALVLSVIVLLISGCSSAKPQAAEPEQPQRVLHVVADPNNLPFSNDKLQGFENKIAEVIAKHMNAKLQYSWRAQRRGFFRHAFEDRKSTRLNSSHLVISYAVFCLKKKNTR